MGTSITSKQVKFLRQRCHHIKPIVTIGGAGLTENVMSEIELALDHHELVKIKLSVDDRDARKQLTDDICRHCQAELVQAIGKTISIYRLNPEKAIIALP